MKNNQIESSSKKSEPLNELKKVSLDHVIEILRRSFYGPYGVRQDKFDIDELIKHKNVVKESLLNKLIGKIENRIMNHNKTLDQIWIDFGPYPLAKKW